MSRIRAAAAALLLASTLSACTPSDDSSTSPTPPPSPPSSSGTPTPSESTTTSPSATPSDGEVTPTQDILDWQPVPGSVDDTVTRSTRTTVTVTADNKTARIAGPQSLELGAGKRSTISTVLVDEQRVVVVVEDTLAERGDEATILDTSGGTAMLTGASSPPTTTGGTWAMGNDTIVHATVSPGGNYCLATVSLESGQGSEGWCAQPHHGFRGAVITPAGLSLMSFDDARPVSCATLLAVAGDTPSPVEGVAECSGWDVALLDGGAIWSEVPQPNRSEKAVFHASVDGTTYDLGPGTTGSLAWCGSAAYFVRDPQTKTDPARLMRFTPDGTLSVVYESKSKGNAFLSAPRCGGDAITLTSYGEQGDEQVTVPLL